MVIAGMPGPAWSWRAAWAESGADHGAAGGSPGIMRDSEGLGLVRPGEARAPPRRRRPIHRSAEPSSAARRSGSVGRRWHSRRDRLGGGRRRRCGGGRYADEVSLDSQQVGSGPAAGIDRDGCSSTVASADALGAGLGRGDDVMRAEIVVGQAEDLGGGDAAGELVAEVGITSRRSKVVQCSLIAVGCVEAPVEVVDVGVVSCRMLPGGASQATARVRSCRPTLAARRVHHSWRAAYGTEVSLSSRVA